MNSSVVPFLGAGFSVSAKSSVDETFKPNVSWLNNQLKNYIVSNFDKLNSDDLLPLQNILELFSKADAESSLSQLAELAQRLSNNPDEILDEIKINLFNTLLPTPAHRYLAYLVREGLINEVITTNYDPCLEDAYKNSFSDPCKMLLCEYSENEKCSYLKNSIQTKKLSKKCSKEKKQNCLHNIIVNKEICKNTEFLNCRLFGVVHNLNTYRRYGARVFTKNLRDYPVLRVYKINGCIRDYVHWRHCLNQKSYKPRILLTERELQKFGSEVWAKELLKDRSRSRSLMFIGFGSEEPQVRHNVLSLMEEFQKFNSGADEEEFLEAPEKVLNLPNAPFMATYDQTMSFNQLQIMSGFIDSNLDLTNKENNDFKERLNLSFGNVITGKDLPWFDNDKKESLANKLGADDFMQALFIAVFGKLIKKYSSREYPFFNWIKEYTNSPSLWSQQIMNILYYSEEKKNFNLFCNLKELFKADDPDYCKFKDIKFQAHTEHPPSNVLLLWKWLYSIKFADDEYKKNSHFDYYLALKDDSLFILLFLTIFTSLIEKNQLIVKPDPSAGLELKLLDKGYKFYIAHKSRNINKNEVPDESEEQDSQFIKIIDLPILSDFDHEGRTYEIVNKKEEKILHIKKYIRIPASELIKESKQPENMDKAVISVFDERIGQYQRKMPFIEKI